MKNLTWLVSIFLGTVLCPLVAYSASGAKQATTAHPFQAQQDAVEFQPHSPVPSFMQALMPRAAKSRYYGSAQISKPNRSELFLHLYEVPRSDAGARESNSPESNAPKSNSKAQQKDYNLNVYVRERGKKASLHLVNSIVLDRSQFRPEYNTDIFEFNFIDARLMWLVPAKRETPIIKLDFIKTDGFYGLFGAEVLVVFVKGLTAKPVVQGFPNYGSHSDSQSNYFDKVDQQGRMIVTQRIKQYFDAPETVIDLLWDGTRFSRGDVGK